MIDGALYKYPTLEGKLSGSGPTLHIGTTNLTENEKELLKALVYGPGDDFPIFDETINITNSNDATTIGYGDSYYAVLTCDPLRTFSDFIVRIGGRNAIDYITDDTYCRRIIDIPHVSGPIQIIGTSVAFITRIRATYTQTQEVHANTNLDELRGDLVVTGGLGTQQVLTDYTLSGELTVGTSTITVDFHGKTDTFDVVVT